MVKRDNIFTEGNMTQSDRCLHTPGAFAKQNLLYLQEVGQLKSLTPHRCVREDLDSYLFLVVLEGKGNLDIKDVHYEIAQGDCALIDCMEHYEHISDSSDAWKLAWVHFNGHSAKGYYDLFMKYNGKCNIFHVDEVNSWEGLLGKLLTKQKKRNLQAELHCGELLLQLLNRIIDNVSKVSIMENVQERQIVNDLRELLNEKYYEDNILYIIDNVFNIEFQEMNIKFVNQYGISIEEYVTSRRFNEAKELLRFSIKPLEEVAKKSGIGDMNVMQQLFREKEGMTAEEYRAKWAAWIR